MVSRLFIYQVKEMEKMVTETKVAEDTVPQVSEPEGTTEAGAIEETVQKAEPETLSFKTQAELDAHIEKESTRRATSIANKSTASYQKQVDELKANLRASEQKTSEKQEDSALARLEKKQQELYGSEEDLPDFQEAQKSLLLNARKFKKEQQEFNAQRDKATTNVRQQQAFTKALELYLVPEDAEEFFTTVKAFAKKLAEAESDREMDLLYALEEERLKRLAEAERNTRDARPDSALGTAPGGVDLNKLSADEQIKRAVREQRTK